jgi:hypothetical protein
MLKPYNDTSNNVAFIGGRGLKISTWIGAENFTDPMITNQEPDSVKF